MAVTQDWKQKRLRRPASPSRIASIVLAVKASATTKPLEVALVMSSVGYSCWADSPPERLLGWLFTAVSGVHAFRAWSVQSWMIRGLLVFATLLSLFTQSPLPLAAAAMTAGAVSAGGALSVVAIAGVVATLLTLARQTLLTASFEGKVLINLWEKIRFLSPDTGRQLPDWSAVFCLAMMVQVIVLLLVRRRFRVAIGSALLFAIAVQLPLGLLWPIPLILMISHIAAHHLSEQKTSGVFDGKVPKLAFGTLLIASIALLASPMTASHPLRRVAVLDGDDVMAKFKQEDYAAPVTLPSFANFVLTLRAGGTEVDQVKNAKDLLRNKDVDTVFIVNPLKVPDASTVDRLMDFVSKGGQVVVLTDHSDIGGIQKPTNSYLAKTHTRALNDSAIPNISRWSWLGRTWAAPGVFGRKERMMGSGFGIGCSLGVEWPARPVIVGTDGFADLGNPKNGQSHLGNLAIDAKEQDGGNVLCSVENIGNGRVVVLGDTSAFQTASTMRTLDSWLTFFEHRDAPFVPALRMAGLVTLLGLLVGIGLNIVRLPIALLGGGLVLWAAQDALDPGAWSAKGPVTKDVHSLVIHDYDASLLAKKVPERDASTLVEIANLDGYAVIPSVGYTKEKPNAILVTAQARKMSGDDAEAILGQVRKGTTLIVTAGYEAQESVQELMKRIDLSVRNVRLGHGGETKFVGAPKEFVGQVPAFKDAWALRIPATSEWKPLCVALGMAPIASRRFGEGRIVYISDSRFLETSNLGHEGKIVYGNVNLYRWLLATSAGHVK